MAGFLQVLPAWSQTYSPLLSPVGLGACGSPARAGEMWGKVRAESTAGRLPEKDSFLNWPMTDSVGTSELRAAGKYSK